MINKQVSTPDVIVCPACSCLCDDIRVKPSVDSLPVFENACSIGQSFFSKRHNHRHESEFTVDGRTIDMEAAVEKAAEILAASKYPLIAGLDAIGTRSQQIAVNIGRQVGGALDTTFSGRGRAATFAMQREGFVTATLGEVANRAEVIVFWFCDPVSTHPRLLQRLGHRQRKRQIAFDQAITETSKISDEFIEIQPSSAVAALSVCEGILAGIDFEDRRVYAQTGHSVETWLRLVDELRQCDYAALFFGAESGFDSSTDASIDRLVSFARRLNADTRFVLLSARQDQNAVGAEDVLAWSTGYATAIDTCRDYSRHYYLEYCAERILECGECDAAMVFLDSSGSRLAEKLIAHLNSIPRIIISDSAPNSFGLMREPSLSVVCDLKGNDDFCRLDDVMLPFKDNLSKPAYGNALHNFMSRLQNILK